MNLLALRSIGFLSPILQILIIAILFIITTLSLYPEVKKTGKMHGVYPIAVSILFAPLYEEIIFRGFALSGFLNVYSVVVAVILTSLLFGLWHLKNIFWVGKIGVVRQMAYAGFIVGPILAVITLWSGTIWLAVILHYLNNLWAPVSQKLFKRMQNAA